MGAARTPAYTGFVHAGAGTALILVQVAAIIPGLLPSLVLAGALAAVLLVPAVVLALAVTVLALPVLALRRLVREDEA